MSDKKWDILHKVPGNKQQVTSNDLLEFLLENRGIKSEKEREEFLHPDITSVTPKSVGIDGKQLQKAIKRIEKAIENKEHVVIFGDYDVDGITASAILWETLYALGAHTSPYIPHRIDEGYGLSQKGIDNVLAEKENVKLIITVDNGIVANAAVDYANSLGIDVIITDHHVPQEEGSIIYPNAHAIVHTTKLCGAGVAYLLAQELSNFNLRQRSGQEFQISNKSEIQKSNEQERPHLNPLLKGEGVNGDHLAFAALGTIADLVPLTNANRAIVKEGLKKLQQVHRPGLLALYKDAGIQASQIGVYEVGRIIAPRLNAMGRMEHAMDSLRLLCTPNTKRAKELASTLSSTNKERQDLTKSTIEHARLSVIEQKTLGNLLFIVHESYQQGIIGLVAGRLVEEFYRPTIVISKGETHSKASARSVHGFNLIEFIRSASDLLVDVGGHPMAAGFTVETTKIELLRQALETIAAQTVTQEHLTRALRIDCEIALSAINENFYRVLQLLAPFGMGNPEPTFVSHNVTIEDIRYVGQEKQHIKVHVFQETSQVMEAIGFGMAEQARELHVGDTIDIVYTVDINEWNGRKRLQLKLKDIRQL